MTDQHPVAQAFHIQDKFLAATVLRLVPRAVKPNHLTIARFWLIPFVAYFLFFGNYRIGLMVFLFTALTDGIDGALARTRNQITEWGRLYDPVADKLLIATAVFIIVLRYIDFWTAILIITIEFLIILVAYVRLKKGANIASANIWGKIKMILQVLGVSLLLVSLSFDWANLIPLASKTLYLAIAFAIVSLLSYGI